MLRIVPAKTLPGRRARIPVIAVIPVVIAVVMGIVIAAVITGAVVAAVGAVVAVAVVAGVFRYVLTATVRRRQRMLKRKKMMSAARPGVAWMTIPVRVSAVIRTFVKLLTVIPRRVVVPKKCGRKPVTVAVMQGSAGSATVGRCRVAAGDSGRDSGRVYGRILDGADLVGKVDFDFEAGTAICGACFF